MAISNLRIPVDATEIKAVATGAEFRQMMQYENGQRTNNPRVNPDTGAILHRGEVVVDIPSLNITGVVNLITDSPLENVRAGDFISCLGPAHAIIANNRDEWGMRVTIEIPSVKIAGNAFERVSKREAAASS